jgi:hypothetical protein
MGLPVLSEARTEFGLPRSVCGCERCRINCLFMPGFLIPADLPRMIPPGADPLEWAKENLRASPGAVVGVRDPDGTMYTYAIPTLVMADREDGSCTHLREDGLCDCHAVAPFGCAFFDCSDPAPERQSLPSLGLRAVEAAWRTDGHMYPTIWFLLDSLGLRTAGPGVKRDRRRLPEMPPDILRRRKVALAYPCAHAAETIHPRFRVVEGRWSTILTVNK